MSSLVVELCGESSAPKEGAPGRLILADDLGLQVGFHLS
jgi:hypothetical protein